MEIIPLGDSALIVRVREQFEDAPEETLNEVMRIFQLLQRAAIPGVIELAPAYTSVAIFFDPVTVPKANGAANGVFDELATRIRNVVSAASRRHRRRTAASAPRLIEIPVCYDPSVAPDLHDVAERCQLSTDQVIELHSGTVYHIYMLGFLPGLAYLGDISEQLAMSRRNAPRARVPAGSVGIAERMTTIFPMATPSG